MNNNMNYYKKNRYKTDLYPKDILQKLEFDKIQELLVKHCLSDLGKSHVHNMKMLVKVDVIESLLLQVKDFKQLELFEEQKFPTDNYIPLHEELKYLAVKNSVLKEEQFTKLLKVLVSISEIVRYFAEEKMERREKYPHLFAMLAELSISKPLLNAIKNILDKNGKVRTDASKELTQIRRAISRCYRDLDRKFNALLAEYKKIGWLTDSEESIRGGRRVFAVKAENKRKIKGIIHDESNTGSISYIEPEATLQLNNEIVELQLAEKREIYRILRDLTNEIRPHVDTIKGYQKIMGLLDFVRAKALLAIDINAAMPQIANDRTVEIFNARHPLLLLKNKALKKKVVPLSFNLSIAERILVVSGPNAGGKSVMLKTAGLIQLMLQMGMLVPCNDNSIMSIFHNIFIDMGDEQSIENDLSTYSSRLKNMRYFTENANGKTLILIDEFGSGTDPALGGPIAEAILEHLTRKFCYGIITTHYSNIKVYASQTAGIANGCMTFDHKNLSPKYKLEIGKPGSSFAFELAEKSGLNEKIINRAKNLVDSDYKEFDELLTTLQREKQDVNNREGKVTKMEAQYKQLIAEYEQKQAALEKNTKKIMLEAKQEAQAELAEANRRFENIVREWNENKGEKKIIKKIKAEIEQDIKEVKQNVEELKDAVYYRPSDKKISVGAYVRLRNGREVGEVMEIRKNNAIVRFDLLKTNVKIKELVVVEKIAPKQTQARVQTRFNDLQARSEFQNNIDIRGMRRQEALKEVENLIDRALMYNVDEVKIIHGIGDGILRRSIRSTLRGYRSVKSINDEDPQYGGAGVSIVALV